MVCIIDFLQKKSLFNLFRWVGAKDFSLLVSPINLFRTLSNICHGMFVKSNSCYFISRSSSGCLTGTSASYWSLSSHFSILFRMNWYHEKQKNGSIIYEKLTIRLYSIRYRIFFVRNNSLILVGKKASLKTWYDRSMTSSL